MADETKPSSGLNIILTVLGSATVASAFAALGSWVLKLNDTQTVCLTAIVCVAILAGTAVYLVEHAASKVASARVEAANVTASAMPPPPKPITLDVSTPLYTAGGGKVSP